MLLGIGETEENLYSGMNECAAFSAGNSSKARSIGYTVEGTSPLRAGSSGTNQVPTCVYSEEVEAFQQNQLGELRTGEISGTLTTNANASGRNTPLVRHNLKVRRLTPKECERLQGFPDNWTKIPYRGKTEDDCTDTPRYKALGNSWATNVVSWIGGRINQQLRPKSY